MTLFLYISLSGDIIKMPYLTSLTPFPVHIDENGLVGELRFRYNFSDDYMVISFKYEKKDHEPAPLIVCVECLGKQYSHELFIIDYCNKIVKTAMFKPEYRVWDGIRFSNIRHIVLR